MAKEDGTERRRFTRVTPDPRTPIRVDINGDNFVEIVTASDISIGGIGLTVPHRFEGCNTNVSVEFVINIPLPEKSLISVSGTIKHVSGDRFGVCFSVISHEAQQKIKRYIAARLKEQSIVAWIKYKLGFVL